MNIFERLRGVGPTVQERKLEERTIASMLIPDGEDGETFIVGEEIKLMGIEGLYFTGKEGKEIITLSPGDEIRVHPFVEMDKYRHFHMPREPRPEEKVRIAVYNAEHPNVATIYVFLKSEVWDRKIKINKEATPQFTN